MQGFEIEWLYTAERDVQYPRSTWLGPSLTGGAVWVDVPRFAGLCLGLHTSRFHAVLDALVSRRADGYWVVAHNEGIFYARELLRRGLRVHVTVHDDLPDGLLARSRRYRAFPPLARATYYDTLRNAHSLDVTSDGMQRHYRTLLGVESGVIHPVVPGTLAERSAPTETGELLAGNIGSVYSVSEWRQFLRALKGLARRRGLRPRMIMIGVGGKLRDFVEKHSPTVETLPDMPEEEAVKALAGCHVLYAMYPFGARAEVFRRTSLPTKLSTYVRCRRPILAHTPRDSTLSELVDAYKLGPICDTLSPTEIEKHLAMVVDAPPDGAAFERAADEVYGAHNARLMTRLLEILAR